MLGHLLPRTAVIYLLLALSCSQLFFLFSHQSPPALGQIPNNESPPLPVKSLPLLTPEKRASLPSLRHRRHWEARPSPSPHPKPLLERGPEGELQVHSPLNLTKLEVTLMSVRDLEDCLHFRFFHSGLPVVDWSPVLMGFVDPDLKEDELRRNFLREGDILRPLCEVQIARETVDLTNNTWGNDTRGDWLVRLELTVTGKGSKRPPIHLAFAIFDEGVAAKLKVSPEVIKEVQGASFSGDGFLMAVAFSLASEARVTPPMGGKLLPGPAIAELGNGLTVAFAEARNFNYKSLRLQELKTPTDLLALFEIDRKQLPKGKPVISPWFLSLVGRSPVDILNSRDLALHLNSESDLADVGWVVPGKVISSKRLSTEAAFQVLELLDLINGQYVLLDSEWYGAENDPALSPTNWDPRASHFRLHIPEIVDYGRKLGIGVILYVNDGTLHRELEDILSLFVSWGVAGVKIGKVQLTSSRDTSRILRTVRRCAERRLVVMIADNYIPSGISRTLPNLLSTGSIRPTPSTALVLPFHALMARSWIQDWSESTTLQVALPLVTSSGLPHLFQTLYPEAIIELLSNPRFPQFEVWRLMPAAWKETHVLDGVIGEYIVVARKALSGSWFIAAIGAKAVPGLVVDLEFLEAEGTYIGTRFVDDPSGDRGEGIAESFTLSRHSGLEFDLFHGSAEIFHISPA